MSTPSKYLDWLHSKRAPRVREYEDESVEVVPDHSMRGDATRMRMAPKPKDYRSNVLPPNRAEPPINRMPSRTLKAPAGTDTDRMWRQPVTVYQTDNTGGHGLAGERGRPRSGGIGAALRKIYPSR